MNTNTDTPHRQPLRRQLGDSDLWVSPVSLGCWPISGISSLDVDDSDSEATIHAAIESGINHFDTAYSYGYDGRSDRVLSRALNGHFDQVVIGSKVGTHYAADRSRVMDASPIRIRQQTDEIRQRLGLDRIDLLYLHSPDGVTPIEKSAETLAEMVELGRVRYVGLSNATLEETVRFSKVIRPIVLQPPFNMLQPDGMTSLDGYLKEQVCGVACYWPLMKGLLAGALKRDHVFEPGDKRLTYPIFQGAAWQRAQDLLDILRKIAADRGWSVARLVVHWTMQQPKITTVLCGAKRPNQIIESAQAMVGNLDDEAMIAINQAISTLTRSTTLTQIR
ncbi:MAG: aldo/keto reductase [Pirellulaceae bacterium]|nr:aldo/keto reductase [Pirellulaceae bacterium]